MTSENDNPQIVYAMLRELLDAMKAFRDASLTPKQLRGVMTHAETVLETVGAPRQSEQWMKEAAKDVACRLIVGGACQETIDCVEQIIAKHAPKEPPAPTEETK